MKYASLIISLIAIAISVFSLFMSVDASHGLKNLNTQHVEHVEIYKNHVHK